MSISIFSLVVLGFGVIATLILAAIIFTVVKRMGRA